MLDQLANADYVIVGAGSAGCALAARLSEDPKVKVVVLEAGGGGDARFLVQMPVGVYKLMAEPEYNWLYQTEADPSLNGRVSAWSAGRLLGGGSSINGMVYIRGARHDYDQWADDGCTGWGWDDVLPYFKKSETYDGPAGPSRGKSGPLRVSDLRIKHPLADAFVEACAHQGLRRVDDYCSGDIDGTFVNQATQHRGQRWSAARGYLRPAMSRPNLTVVTGAMVDRVIVEDSRAVGVEFEHDGRTLRAMARREVILSAGAVQSPTVLMRSGIGPGVELSGLGIEVKADAARSAATCRNTPASR